MCLLFSSLGLPSGDDRAATAMSGKQCHCSSAVYPVFPVSRHVKNVHEQRHTRWYLRSLVCSLNLMYTESRFLRHVQGDFHSPCAQQGDAILGLDEPSHWQCCYHYPLGCPTTSSCTTSLGPS